MNACTFNKFHYTGNEDIYAVTYGINFEFLALDVLINKYGLILIYLNSGLQVVAEILILGDYLHCASAEYE